ncbi:MFS family permease [Lipingzhangella halophila]|uniref:MFS family permease n=1 Tax=Lipingzhangella halophila TaxID=1783352 RepID=A0A7W7RIJ1_9ACTN|nr:MFS transporter [Lipingzhangella halophila]MBB4932628.1 MFS family permease [Lipingzhangella halophila]
MKRSFDDGPAQEFGNQLAKRTRERRTAAYLLVVLTAGAYLPSPLLPGYQHAFGFSDLVMTLIYATFALVSAPALLLFGPAADALGPRPVLRSSVGLAALGSACFALAAGPEWLLAGRAAQGLALGAATGAATALMIRNSPAEERLRASMLAGMAFVAGTAAGPIAAGALAQYAPAPTVLPYLIHLALLAEGLRRVSALSASTPHPRRWRPTRPHVPTGLRARFATAAATGFLAWTAAGLFLAVIPAVLTRAARIDDLAITGGLVGAVLICSVLAQPLVARLGAPLAQLTGLGVLTGALSVLAATGGGSPLATLIAAVAAGTGHGLAYGGATAAVDAAAPDEHRGAISSALHLAFYLGAGGPAVAVGLLTISHDLTTAVSWLSAAAAVLAPLVAATVPLVHRTRHSAPATQQPLQAEGVCGTPAEMTRSGRHRRIRRFPAIGRPDPRAAAGHRNTLGRRRGSGGSVGGQARNERPHRRTRRFPASGHPTRRAPASPENTA